MNRYLSMMFSGLLLCISVLVARGTPPDLQLFISTNQILNFARVGLAVLLLAYCVFSYLRHRTVQLMLRGIGLALLAVGVSGVISPTYFGLLSSYVLPLDLFIALEGGVSALLASLSGNTGLQWAGRPFRLQSTRVLEWAKTSKLAPLRAKPLRKVLQ